VKCFNKYRFSRRDIFIVTFWLFFKRPDGVSWPRADPVIQADEQMLLNVAVGHIKMRKIGS
jgi:hypothetical protein